MQFAYSAEFRSMVVEQMRDGRSVAGLARELEMHESTLHRWKRQDRVDRGLVSGVGTAESARLREARRRIRELEAELAAAKRASELFEEGREGRVVRPKEMGIIDVSDNLDGQPVAGTLPVVFVAWFAFVSVVVLVPRIYRVHGLVLAEFRDGERQRVFRRPYEPLEHYLIVH